MEFVFVLAGIVFIMLDYFISKEFQDIAQKKGHGGVRYFWWTFFTGAVGMLMVVALPDRSGSAEQPRQSAAEELPDL